MLTLRSKQAWKVVSDRAAHYEYTDMSLCCPRFLKAVGLVSLSPQARVVRGGRSEGIARACVSALATLFANHGSAL